MMSEEVKNTPLIIANNLAKSYGNKQALKPSTFEIPIGRIVGIIGANGAGKSTLLNCLLGLSDFDGDLSILGLNPLQNRATLMNDVCFIADVATLPKWAKISDLIGWIADIHPKFDKALAIARIEKAKIPLKNKVKTLSKGMMVQVHLAIALAIDAKLLVLDEPTLGLDIINRHAFYDAILQEFFDENRTILVTTHQIDEIEPILSHAMFIKDGNITLNASIDEIAESYFAIDVSDESKAQAQELKPIYSRSLMGRTTYIFNNQSLETLKAIGEPRRVALADLFVALAS
jgi:ABC-2 type transport system ATP-binding protein